MFSYQHHIGDFRRDTASLSDTDSMAYLKLLWMYYDTELPLPADAKLLAFKIGSNPDSVQLILDAFFTLDGNVYRQKRCDAEIFKYKNKGQKARDSANARWNNANAFQTHSDSNADAPKNDANREPITEIKEIKTKTLARPEDVPEELWLDFKQHRKAKRATITERVIKTLRSEGEKANLTLSQVMEKMIVKGWTGFDSSWIKPNETKSAEWWMNDKRIK